MQRRSEVVSLGRESEEEDQLAALLSICPLHSVGVYLLLNHMCWKADEV